MWHTLNSEFVSLLLVYNIYIHICSNDLNAVHSSALSWSTKSVSKCSYVLSRWNFKSLLFRKIKLMYNIKLGTHIWNTLCVREYIILGPDMLQTSLKAKPK